MRMHAQVISGPIASALLLADGAGGLKGWQWLFLIEGIPTILLGFWVGNPLHTSLACLLTCLSSLCTGSVTDTYHRLGTAAAPLLVLSIRHSVMKLHSWVLQIFFTLQPNALKAKFLTPAEQEYVHQRVKDHKVRGFTLDFEYINPPSWHRSSLLRNVFPCLQGPGRVSP